MGLNWSEGLKQAGQGLDQMTNIKMQEADYIYKEMAQQNRQRFSTSERESEQDFLTSERGAKETFQSSEGDKDRASRDAATEAQRENTQAYRDASLGVQRQRNQGLETDRQTDNERMQADQDQKVIDAIDEKIAEYSDPMYLGDQETAQAEVEKLNQMKGLISEYGGVAGARAYLKIAKVLPDKEQSEIYSSTYAMMSAEERKATDKRMLQLRREGNDKMKAYALAIDEYIDGGPPSAASGPSGTVSSPEQTIEVDGGAGPQKKIGPPAPDQAPEQKPLESAAVEKLKGKSVRLHGKYIDDILKKAGNVNKYRVLKAAGFSNEDINKIVERLNKKEEPNVPSMVESQRMKAL